MTDPALHLLQPVLQTPHRHALWFADEHVTDTIIPAAVPGWEAITNRYNVATQLQQRQWPVQFSDFDTSNCATDTYDAVAIRIAKEKAINHHLINTAGRLLKPGGLLYLAGHKQQGIKTYGKKAAAYLHSNAHEKKHSGYSLFTLIKGDVTGKALDDQDYSRLRTVHELNGKPVVSKPGVFGWDRIDQGSTLLTAHAKEWSHYGNKPVNILDLGCGSGYLLLSVCPQLNCNRIVAVDNNAAAISATQHNLTVHGFDNAHVIADDCGNKLHEAFDLILCNPPFHQGFGTESALTTRFVQAAASLLQRDGMAIFVVNNFVPLAKQAAGFFMNIELLADDGQFRVFSLSKQR